MSTNSESGHLDGIDGRTYMKARGTRSGDQRLAPERATHLDRLYPAVAKALDKFVDAVGLNLGAISFAEVGGCFMRPPQ